MSVFWSVHLDEDDDTNEQEHVGIVYHHIFNQRINIFAKKEEIMGKEISILVFVWIGPFNP